MSKAKKRTPARGTKKKPAAAWKKQKAAAPKKKPKAVVKTKALTKSSPKKKLVRVRSRSDDRRSMVEELKAEEHKREEVVLGGWPAGITTYRIGALWICKVDNVSPGATVARGRGKTREEALEIATTAATRRLAATRVHR